MGRKKKENEKGVVASPAVSAVLDLTPERIELWAGPLQLERARGFLETSSLVKAYREGSDYRGVFIDFLGVDYSAEVFVRKHGIRSACSCEDREPCVHAVALLLVAHEELDHFMDLEDFLDGLEKLSRPELLLYVRTLIFHNVADSLETLRFPGFVESEVEVMDDGLDALGEAEEDLWDDWDEDNEPPTGGGTAH
jgi:hypothetical protein